MSGPLLKVRDLKVHFPVYAGLLRRQVDVVKAVDGIDFDIYPGEVLGLVGESGSGKSTAARGSTRLIEPTSGSIVFEGEDVLSMSRNALFSFRTEVQFVFQDPYTSLNPRKSIGRSIGEGLSYHKMVKDEQELQERVFDLLRQVGLRPEMYRRYPHELSGGQQQRVCIARAIAMKPKLLVCDEAVSALDISVQAQILNLLLDLKEQLNLSFLFITHDLSVVRHFADRVLVMTDGKIVEEKSTQELFDHPEHPYTKKLLDAIPMIPVE